MAAPESSTREKLHEYTGYLAESNLPIPDPTKLTTQLVDRTILAFRELVEVRLADMDKAILLAAKQVEKIPAETTFLRDQLRAEIDRQMLALREFILSRVEKIEDVNAEKFEGGQ